MSKDTGMLVTVVLVGIFLYAVVMGVFIKAKNYSPKWNVNAEDVYKGN